LGARQRDLEGRLAVAEAKMKDRRMRITRIRNDKELGLARREGSCSRRRPARSDRAGAVMEQVEGAAAKLAGLEAELARLVAERDREASELRETLAACPPKSSASVPRAPELAQTIDDDLGASTR